MDFVDIFSKVVAIILQCATLITVVYTFVKFTQRPTESLEERVGSLESWRSKTENRLHDGVMHFQSNDESNKVTQNALFAIMDALGSMESVPEDKRIEILKRKSDLMEYLVTTKNETLGG